MATQPTARASRFLRYFAIFSVVLVSLATSVRSLYAEPDLLEHRPWTAGFGSLCDGGPLVCTRIDELAFNARIDAIVLTGTNLRGIGLVAPYGFSFGVLEHVASIPTSRFPGPSIRQCQSCQAVSSASASPPGRSEP